MFIGHTVQSQDKMCRELIAEDIYNDFLEQHSIETLTVKTGTGFLPQTISVKPRELLTILMRLNSAEVDS